MYGKRVVIRAVALLAGSATSGSPQSALWLSLPSVLQAASVAGLIFQGHRRRAGWYAPRRPSPLGQPEDLVGASFSLTGSLPESCVVRGRRVDACYVHNSQLKERIAASSSENAATAGPSSSRQNARSRGTLKILTSCGTQSTRSHHSRSQTSIWPWTCAK